mmetsp:Transcript_30147/g.93250  ORF Transcript_30147/g.93250 Transcript_30147/m.93250 type:complete len:177 (+) Transcript_30147:495-1025(+)
MVEGTAPSSSSRQQLAPSSSSRRELGARSTRRYERALAAALGSSRDRGLASIPASNRAQVALELGEAADAQRRTESLLRRDPNFVDGRALLAAVKYERGDKAGAEEAYAQLCVPAIASQSGATLTRGLGSDDWCELYSTSDVVRGRWTPAAISAYEAFLASRDRRARLAADSRGVR